MGWSDFWDKMKELGDIISESKKEFDDLKDELGEILTDGVIADIKGDKSYKTSFEIRDEANRIIYRSEEKYRDASNSFNSYLAELNTITNDLYDKKVQLAKRLNMNISKNQELPIYDKVMKTPEYTYKRPDYSFEILTIPAIQDQKSPMYGIYRGIIDKRERKEAAKEYLESAKDFEVAVLAQITEIDKNKAFLNGVKMNLSEEERLINALNDSVNSRMEGELSAIEKQLHTLIAEYILNPNGTQNAKYVEAVELLKKLTM